MAHNSPKLLSKTLSAQRAGTGAKSQHCAAIVLLAERHIGGSIPFSACHVHQPTTDDSMGREAAAWGSYRWGGTTPHNEGKG